MPTIEEMRAALKNPQANIADMRATLKTETPQEEQPDIFENAKNVGLKGLQYAGKALDYPGGVVRTGLGATFQKNVTGQDVLNALKGNPLSGDELLERAGESKGGSLSDILPIYSNGPKHWYQPEKGGMLDPTRRGAEGLALEMITDPLSLLALGTSKAASMALKAGKELTPAEKLLQYTTRPIGRGLEEAGKSRYASALRNVDESLKIAGKPPVSPVFIQNEMPVGSMQTLREKSKDLASKAGRDIGNIESEATSRGATVNMLPAMNDSMELSSEMRKSPHPNVQQAGQKLDDITASYLGQGEKVPVDKARAWSSEANKLASEQAFNPMTAGNVPFASEGNREIGQGLKGEVYNAIDKTTPELSDQYKLANKQYSSLSSKDAKRELKNASKVEKRKNGITLVDAGLGAGSLATPQLLPVLLGKKLMELGNSAYGRTATGKSLYNLGHYGDQILRRPSAWQSLYDKYNQENPGEGQ